MQVFDGFPPVSAERRAVMRQLTGLTSWVLYGPGDALPPFGVGSRGAAEFYVAHVPNNADDTQLLQKYIDALPPGGVIDGGEQTFIVTSLALKSDITVKNFKFLTKPGAPDFSSPITIGKYNAEKAVRNIKIVNVHIDGNRANQHSIGTAEDGGRHGFRLIGYVSDIEIDGCSANYCGTDGICIFTGTGNKKSWPRFSNVVVKNSVFNFNRRHGGSADSIFGLQLIDCHFNNNGGDLPGVTDSTPQNDGLRGASAYGSQYGNGFDVETYGSGYHVNDVNFIRCEALQNVRAGILFYEIADQQSFDFVPSQNIRISGCTIDNGLSSKVFALDFTSKIENKSGSAVLKLITISENTISGQIGLRCVEDVAISGGSVTTLVPRIGNADNARGIFVAADVQRSGKFFETSESSVTYEDS